MPLINMNDMLRHAYHNGYAVGAFELINLEFLESVISAAEYCRAPVILTLAEPRFDCLNFELIMPAVEAVSRRTSVPVAIQLDRGTSLETAVRGINSGCNGVMIDASHEALPDNISRTREVVDMAHGCGVPVEGELVWTSGFKEDDVSVMNDTAIIQAESYVEQTGVDFLSVSVGGVQGRMKADVTLSVPRLKGMNEALGMPLVIQDHSGISSDQLRKLSANGAAKISYSTALLGAASAYVKGHAEKTVKGEYTNLIQGVRDAVSSEAQRCMRLCGSAERGAEVLNCCRSWMPVEHVIIYNVKGVDEHDVDTMMAEGRRVLSAIPGVREVVTGKAVQESAKYRYVWLVRFCDPAVIERYRDHPDHVAFADNRFRPVAGDRISIDYQTVAPDVLGAK